MNTIIQSMKGMSSFRVIALSVVGVILLLSFAFLSMKLTSPVLSPLYANLSPEDSTAVVTELSAMGVSFDVHEGSGKIMVASNEILRVRMALAAKGLPNKGSVVGYEIFDKEESLGTSSFVLNVNLLRALEGELARTISALSSVKSARVHLAIPKKNLFNKNAIEPSASVVLTLHDKVKPPKSEITSVQHLVSSAVQNLRLSRVTIIDEKGRLLARGAKEEDDDGNGLTALSNTQEYKLGIEKRYKRVVESLLEEVIGYDKVRAEVTAEVNFDRKSSTSEEFDPEGAVARSVQSSENKTNSSEGTNSTVSVANNLPDGGGNAGGASSENNSLNSNELTNFEISKKITNHTSSVGTIEKLSIAVLVDGNYETTIDEEENETSTYIPRTDEELEQIRTLVRSAVGFDVKRGDSIEVINMQFTNDAKELLLEEDPFAWLKKDLGNIIKTVIVGLIAILTILLVIRPMVNKAFEISPSDLASESQQAVMDFSGIPQGGGAIPVGGGGTVGAAVAAGNFSPTGSGGGDDLDLGIIQDQMDGSPTKKINDLIDNNPEETLQVIRSWMTDSKQEQ